MSAKHAVLGLVIEQPSYGYQLAQRMQERCGAWGWESTGVYSALDSLTRDGYVQSLREKGSGDTGRAAPRVIYQATPAGVEFFQAWLCESSAPSPARQELDLKLLFSGPELIPRLIELTWAQEQQYIDDLGTLPDTTQIGAADRTSTWSEVAVLLQRDAEVRLLQMRIEWLQQAREVMERMLDRSADAQPGIQCL